MSSKIPEITEFILNNFPLAKSKGITEDTDLLNEGVIDSLGLLSLIQFVEDLTQSQVADEDVIPDNFCAIRQINDYVGRLASQIANEQAS